MEQQVVRQKRLQHGSQKVKNRHARSLFLLEDAEVNENNEK